MPGEKERVLSRPAAKLEENGLLGEGREKLPTDGAALRRDALPGSEALVEQPRESVEGENGGGKKGAAQKPDTAARGSSNGGRSERADRNSASLRERSAQAASSAAASRVGSWPARRRASAWRRSRTVR